MHLASDWAERAEVSLYWDSIVHLTSPSLIGSEAPLLLFDMKIRTYTLANEVSRN